MDKEFKDFIKKFVNDLIKMDVDVLNILMEVSLMIQENLVKEVTVEQASDDISIYTIFYEELHEDFCIAGVIVPADHPAVGMDVDVLNSLMVDQGIPESTKVYEILPTKKFHTIDEEHPDKFILVILPDNDSTYTDILISTRRVQFSAQIVYDLMKRDKEGKNITSKHEL